MKKITFCLIFVFSIKSHTVIDRIVAVVNSEPILQSDLNSLEKKIESRGLIDDLLLGELNKDDLKNNLSAKLDYLISEKIFDSEIKRLNLTVTMDRVDQEIRKIAANNKISKEDLLKSVNQQGMSTSEYQNFIKIGIERQSLIEQEITSRIRINDEEVLAYFKQKKPQTRINREFTISQIFFNTKKSGIKKAFERAQKAFIELKGQSDFSTVAEKYSEDKNFSNGGLIGTFSSEDLSSDMLTVIEKLSEGEFSAPSQTSRGIHIFKINKIVEGKNADFEKFKEQYRSEVFSLQFKKQVKNWLATKRAEFLVSKKI
jgi:peptidyl-prolyl cis-trans isomerase SurA